MRNFGRGPPKEQSKFCWNLPSSYGGDVVRIFPIFSSGHHFVQCMVRNNWSNFGRAPPKELSYKVWFNTALWLQRRYHLNFFLFLALVAILCSDAERLKQFGERISQRTIVSSLVEIYPVIIKELLLEGCFFFTFSSGGHFVQWSRKI